MRIPRPVRVMLWIAAFTVAAIATLLCINTAAYAAWLSAHPQYDDELWARRSLIWLGVVVVLVYIQIHAAVVLWKRRAARRRAH